MGKYHPCLQKTLRLAALTRHRIESAIINPFATGKFLWKGELKPGKQQPLVSWELHEASLRGLHRLNKPKYRVHAWPYAGLVLCGRCGRTVVFEIKKKKYIYGHCAGINRGDCQNIYLKEAEFEAGFEAAVRAIEVKPEVAQWIMGELARGAQEETLV